jgi:hypothetical protein
MKKPILAAVALCVAFFGSSMLSPSHAFAQSGSRAPRGSSANANDTYYVVQIGEEYKVVAKSRFKDEQKRLDDDYKKALKEWLDRRRIEPDAKRPVKLIIKKIGTPFQTEKVAQEEAQKLKDEAAAKQAGKAPATK